MNKLKDKLINLYRGYIALYTKIRQFDLDILAFMVFGQPDEI